MEVTTLLQQSAITSAFWASGALFSFSSGGVSAVKLAAVDRPFLARDQWLTVHAQCHKICSPLVMFTAGCSFWLRYQTGKNVYLAAALSCLAIVPFSVFLLDGPERRILDSKLSKENTIPVPESGIPNALRQWGSLNMFRSLFPFIGGVCILVPYLSGHEVQQ